MQANKRNNNGWILCPSKSFPGKLYYFNVVNGEAAWSLDEVEKKSLKPDCTIQKVVDKSHTFPEPDTPPLEDSFTLGTNICHQQVPNYLANMPSQKFGEPVFPKYFPSVATPVPVFWAPMQMIVPHEAKKVTSSRVTQTFEPDCVIGHSTDIPLSKRFSKPIFYNENKFENRFPSNKFCDTSTYIQFNASDTNCTETSDIFKYPKIQPLKKPKPRSNSESEIGTEVPSLFKNVKINSTLSLPNRVKLNQSTFTQTPYWSIDSLTHSNKAENLATQIKGKNLLKSDENVNIDDRKSNLKINYKVDNSNSTEHNELDSEDLRYLIVAKRRQSFDCGDINEGKKLKSANVTNITPKKRVTFNLGSLEDSGSDDEEPKYSEPMEEVNNPSIEHLRNLAKPSMNKDVWYLVVDTEILLDNYEFIDKFVQSDDRCKLLIPHVVKSDIEIMSKGDCCGRHRIIVARQLCRRLSTPGDHVVLQTSDITEDNQFVTNSIINCCIEMTRTENRHVILITNDTVLLKKAKTLSIHGYKLQNIKDGVVPTQKVTFDIKSRKIHVNNDVKENLFLQNNIKNNKNSNNTFKGLFNSQNSTILDDKLINITKPKNIVPNKENTINYESDTIDSTSEIGRNIKGINLKDSGRVNVKKSLFENEKQFDNASKSIKLIYIEEDIKKYYVKNKLMEEKIKLGIDEWICTYSQIMEDVLTSILLQNSSHYGIPPPWYLCEAVECIKVMYTQEPMIVSIVKKFSILLFNCSSDKGILKSNINAKDFMKILGYGITLIQTLQEITQLQELKEAQNKLESMLRKIEDPTVECENEVMPPVVIRSDVTETVHIKRSNFQKNRSDIIQYLQKNFTQWKSYNEESKIYTDVDKIQVNHHNKDPKVVRTFGKNLGLLKIDNTKNISMIKSPSEPHSLIVDTNKKTEGPKVVRNLNSIKDLSYTRGNEVDATKNLQEEYNAIEMLRTTHTNEDRMDDPKVIRNFGNINRFSFKKTENENMMQDNNKGFRSNANYFGNDLDIPKHGNTFEVAEEKKDGPKVIRPFENVNSISSVNSRNKYRENEIELGVTKRELKNEPKVIINMKLIDVFEEKIMKKSKELNMDDLDYEVEDSISSININNMSQNINNCDNNKINDDEANNNLYSLNHDTSPQIRNTQKKYIRNNENLTNDILNSKNTNMSTNTNNENNENTNITVTSVFFNNVCNQHTNLAQNNDTSDIGFVSLRDDSTNDSGFENESLQAYSLAKSFLTEVSSSFKMIYNFIDKSINEVRDEELQEDKKKILQNKANRTHVHIGQVIEKLKSIIERESNDGKTLKSFLIKAGDVSGDKRMSRYRQVVTKSLEQAQMLENALKFMLNIIDNDFTDHPFLANNNNSLKYYNVFE